MGQIEKKIECFKTCKFFTVFQNGLAFLGRIWKASLSEFPEIYDQMEVQSWNTGDKKTFLPFLGHFLNEKTCNRYLRKW